MRWRLNARTKVEKERKLKITQKIKEMSRWKFITSQQININIDDHHSRASHNKQQKHCSSVHCLLLLSDTIFCSLSASTIKYCLWKKNFKLSKSQLLLQLSSWEFKSSRRACANKRKRRNHDNTLHNYIKRLQSNSWNITKQWNNCQNSDLRKSENKHECYC